MWDAVTRNGIYPNPGEPMPMPLRQLVFSPAYNQIFVATLKGSLISIFHIYNYEIKIPETVAKSVFNFLASFYL